MTKIICTDQALINGGGKISLNATFDGVKIIDKVIWEKGTIEKDITAPICEGSEIKFNSIISTGIEDMYVYTRINNKFITG